MKYEFLDLVKGRTYLFYVSACNAVGCKDSSVLGPVVIAEPPSRPPRVLLRNASLVPVPFLDVAFFAPEDSGGAPIVSLQLYKDDGLDGPLLPWFATDEITAGHRLDVGVEPGRYYRYKVVARNLAGESESSDVASFLVAGRPNAPSLIAMTDRSRDSLALGWEVSEQNGGADVVSFTLYRDDGANGPFFAVYRGPGTNFTDVNLETGRTYRYRVSSSSRAGESDLSKTFSFVPREVSGLFEQPNLLSVSCGNPTAADSTSGSAGGSARIKWRVPGGAAFDGDYWGCRIERVQLLMDGKVQAEVDAKIDEFLVTNLTCATVVKFSVRGKNCLGMWTGESLPLEVPVADVPAVVPDLVGAAVGRTSIEFRWGSIPQTILAASSSALAEVTANTTPTTNTSLILGYQLWMDDGLRNYGPGILSPSHFTPPPSREGVEFISTARIPRCGVSRLK